MNKRYIDFVPVDKRKKVKVEKQEKEIPLEEMFAERIEPIEVSAEKKSAKFGVIEDYRPKFVKTEVKKRPLGAKPALKSAPKVKKPAAVKPVPKPVAKPAIKPAAKIAVKADPKAAAKKAAPAGAIQAKFINLNKIEKRPLSKNVYARKPAPVQAPKKEESKKPTVIITKPEKSSKVGMIVAVILTIILGAAAGTVAFLLLPK